MINVNVVRNTNGAPSFPKGVDNLLSKKEPIRKMAKKSLPADLLQEESKVPTQEPEVQKERRTKLATSSSEMKDTNANAGHQNGATADPVDQLRSTPKYFVERHTPEKKQLREEEKEAHTLIPERKNLLQDLEDSVEITTVQGVCFTLYL